MSRLAAAKRLGVDAPLRHDVPMAGVRRSRVQAGGAIERAGEPALAAELAAAWRAAEQDEAGLTHPFHAYPARAHPALVRTLIEAFSQPGDLVADPFCGSGTTLVEACATGRRALGADVNGIAVALARLKSRRTSARWRATLLAAAGRIAGRAAAAAQRGDDDDDRKAGVPAELWSLFEPQVWRELDALGRAIDGERDAERHTALLLVLSSLLTKVSRREAETSERTRERHLARGFTARLFADRAGELAAGLAALAKAAAASAPSLPPPLVALADSRALPVRSGAAALVVTSPPYAGTYDYARIQELRARLIGIGLDAARRHEIGARLDLARDPEAALASFRRAFGAALAEIARVLEPDGRAVLILGDSRIGRRELRADDMVGEMVGERSGEPARGRRLKIAATASQTRPEPRPLGAPLAGPRREHLILLVRKLEEGKFAR
jgi:SAM-dependent methyltransferase